MGKGGGEGSVVKGGGEMGEPGGKERKKAGGIETKGAETDRERVSK